MACELLQSSSQMDIEMQLDSDLDSDPADPEYIPCSRSESETSGKLNNSAAFICN